MRCSVLLAPLVLLVASAACSAEVAAAPPEPPPCDEACLDGVALRGLRETAKLAFNLTLQGKPVGTHEEVRPCPLGGGVRVRGRATSNAVQGATEVDLTYDFLECGYEVKDEDANETYDLVLTGSMTQVGVLAVQPSSSSALVMKSERMRITGTVHDPPKPYDADCPLDLGQNGNRLNGKICGRSAGTDL